jgi:hypothetical protein
MVTSNAALIQAGLRQHPRDRVAKPLELISKATGFGVDEAIDIVFDGLVR